MAPNATPDPGASEAEQPEDEYAILCRQCLQPITRPQARITVNGAHQHTFANPSGIVYQIGCFESAPGCGPVGPATDEFSWFPGFSWRIALCRACLIHIGWRFSGTARESFYGLILDRLVFPD